MQEIRSSRAGLVELLATWELTSRPGVTGLLSVMSRFRGRDELALLGDVADSPGIALVPGLREEVRGVLRKAREPSSVEPEFRDQISDVVGKASDALASYAREQRVTLQRDLLECASRLPQADRERVFRLMWESGETGATGRLDQVRSIDEARTLLDGLKSASATDLEGSGIEEPEIDDPAAMEQARRDLESTIEKGERVRAGAEGLPPRVRELVDAALDGARAALKTENVTLRTLAGMGDALEVLTSGIQEESFVPGFDLPTATHGGGQTGEQVEAVSDLRHAIDTANEELERVAPLLPTDRVVEFRTRVSEAESATYSADVSVLKRCLSELRHDGEEIRRLAEQQRRFEEDRSVAEAERLAGEIERLSGLARRGDARRLASLRADLEHRNKRASVASSIPELAARIENKQRLDLAIRLRRARACSGKARDRMQREIDAAKEALAGDDLHAIQDAAQELNRALRKAAPWRGPRGWVAGAVLLTVVLGAGVVALRGLGTDTTKVTFVLEATTDVDTVNLVLVRDGEVVAERHAQPGQSVDFSLPAGRFEVFVNDRYTGRVVRVPQDIDSMDPIPVPR